MTNDITIISCPQCGFPRIRDCGNGLYQCDDCGTHFDKNENIVLTEQEWLQTATTEQLAEWLADKLDYCQIMWYWACDKCTWSKKHESCMNDKEKWVEWLKQPHREERENEMS